MNSVLVKIYHRIPVKLRKKIGQAKWLKGFRRVLLYNDSGFKTATVKINRKYGDYDVDFKFVASIKTSSKAKYVGIENTVLRNSFQLVKTYFPNRIDLKVLDIGANFGYLGSVWANSVARNGNVYAFEPNKNLYRCIEKTITLNADFKSNFKVYNNAVGNFNKTITLNASAFSSNTNKMTSSIETYNVEMVRIDDVVAKHRIHQINLIKIDVDGIELDILKGASNVIRDNKPIVIVETNSDKKIIDFFKNLDYIIYDMKLDHFDDSNVLPLNIFCVPKTLTKDVV
ncbi:FkbM family methyltransferase [Winogradskyella sp.]|uniref:FkbM family methyltransferase n=1 Tax=Winogradskyella sp. TaxID=1883156 RepID=UPI0025FA73AF|nr:FkbM family methyltransferase [Winogradskyella sp.]